MADFPLNSPITEAITTNNLNNLKYSLTELHNRLLARAITHNSDLIIPHLISLGANPCSKPASTALLDPATFPYLLTFITECDYDVNTNLDRLGTFLIRSVKRNNADEVRILLSHGADPNLGLYAYLFSPLATAAEYGASLEIVDMLLGAGARVQDSDALHVAAGKGVVDMVRRLVDSGADVNEIGFKFAVIEGFAEIAGSALHFAVDGGSEEVVRLLLERGADLQLKDAQGRTALERAREKGHETCVALLNG